MVILDESLPKVPDGALHPDLALVAGSSGHRSRIGAHKAPALLEWWLVGETIGKSSSNGLISD